MHNSGSIMRACVRAVLVTAVAKQFLTIVVAEGPTSISPCFDAKQTPGCLLLFDYRNVDGGNFGSGVWAGSFMVGWAVGAVGNVHNVKCMHNIRLTHVSAGTMFL